MGPVFDRYCAIRYWWYQSSVGYDERPSCGRGTTSIGPAGAALPNVNIYWAAAVGISRAIRHFNSSLWRTPPNSKCTPAESWPQNYSFHPYRFPWSSGYVSSSRVYRIPDFEDFEAILLFRCKYCHSNFLQNEKLFVLNKDDLHNSTIRSVTRKKKNRLGVELLWPGLGLYVKSYFNHCIVIGVIVIWICMYKNQL